MNSLFGVKFESTFAVSLNRRNGNVKLKHVGHHLSFVEKTVSLALSLN